MLLYYLIITCLTRVNLCTLMQHFTYDDCDGPLPGVNKICLPMQWRVNKDIALTSKPKKHVDKNQQCVACFHTYTCRPYLADSSCQFFLDIMLTLIALNMKLVSNLSQQCRPPIWLPVRMSDFSHAVIHVPSLTM